jgi:hypothetical protein
VMVAWMGPADWSELQDADCRTMRRAARQASKRIWPGERNPTDSHAHGSFAPVLPDRVFRLIPSGYFCRPPLLEKGQIFSRRPGQKYCDGFC